MTELDVDDDPPARVVELVVNLDDVTGEQVGATIDRLMCAGALDAWSVATTMKKGRPGVMLSVLAREDQREEMAKQVLEETGSFGVRFRAWDRLVLGRTYHERETALGRLTIKAGSLDGKLITAKAEFDKVVSLASESGISLSEAASVASAAADALLAELKQGGGHA